MLQAQDHGDWQGLWATYGPKLLLFARQQTRELSQAEDIVQEAFVRYWKSLQTHPALPATLMFTMVRRIATDHARRSSAQRARDWAAQSAADAREVWFADPVEERERREIIEASLKALPQNQREVVVLKIWAGLTFEEIGQALEVSPNTAASRYRYALTQLRELLMPSVS